MKNNLEQILNCLREANAEGMIVDTIWMDDDQTLFDFIELCIEEAALAQQEAEPVAWLYTLEYGSSVVNKKISLNRLRYPFGIVGADYCAKNDDGVSYVRETSLHPPKPAAKEEAPCQK